jgi:argininosuccinate lyase
MPAIDRLQAELRQLQVALIEQAEGHLETLLPGYTHLQPAQPISWAHWLLAHFWPLTRDARRLAAGAAAGGCPAPRVSGIGRDDAGGGPAALAAKLGFSAVTPNSLDAVSDRDFAADFLYAGAMLAVHLSRLAEQLILFSSAEFGFVQLADQYSTGSSLMPQKKNPDTLELTRGKSGRLIGHLTGLLATLKGLPSTYDKDLQEDKEPVFDAFDNLMLILPVMAGVIKTLQLRPERMTAQLEAGLLATDLADYLVHKGVPFREAHGLVGAAVQLAEQTGREINQLSLAELQAISSYFSEGVSVVFDMQQALQRRNIPGGTGPAAVAAQLAAARQWLESDQKLSSSRA